MTAPEEDKTNADRLPVEHDSPYSEILARYCALNRRSQFCEGFGYG